MADGIDVYYKYQTINNPGNVRNSGHQFAYIKTGDGAGVVNQSSARAQARTLQSGGVKVGAYYFAQPSGNPESQAQDFYNSMQGVSWDLAPALDIEQAASGVNYTTWSQRFINKLRQLTGKQKVVLYTSKSWITGGQINAAGFDANTWFWIARYYTNSPTVSTLGWSHPRLAVYQYWNKGTVPGINGSGNVDLNMLVLPLSTISASSGGGAAAPQAKQKKDRIAHMISFPAHPGPSTTTGTFALPGVPCRVVLTPGRKADGTVDEIGVAGVDLKTDYMGSTEGVGYLRVGESNDPVELTDRPAKWDLTGVQVDALSGTVIYHSTAPVTVSVYFV